MNNKRLVPKHQWGALIKRMGKAYKYFRHPVKTAEEEAKALKAIKSKYSYSAKSKFNRNVLNNKDKFIENALNSGASTENANLMARREMLNVINKFNADEVKAYDDFKWDWTYPKYAGYGAIGASGLGATSLMKSDK